MLDGLLLSLPTESVAVRAVVASAAAVLLGRILLRAGLRVPRMRAAAALVPAAALIVVVALSWASLRPPALMLPVEAVGALPVPVRNGYLNFAPIAAPLLGGLWALIAGGRIAYRLLRIRQVRRAVLAGVTTGAAPDAVHRHVRRIAVQLHIATPPVGLAAAVAGGATVVGIRRPLVVVDERLVDQLDSRELEGVLAHELAHITRRDNLVALLVGVVRDLTFFVPGGRWALRRLHVERELAADQSAMRTTGRPASLASGLLKVMEGRAPAGAAALAPPGTLVDRVRFLVDERTPGNRMRSGAEIAAVATILVLSVGAAMELPSMAAGSAGQRDAMAVVWSSVSEVAEAAEREIEARVFQVYRRSSLGTDDPVDDSTLTLDDDPVEIRRSTLRACGSSVASCPDTATDVGLGIRPRPIIRVDEQALLRWGRATPVFSSDDLGLYWLDASTGRVSAATR